MNNLRQETVYTPRDAHSECNIPAPVGSGLVPDRKGPGVGSVTSTPRDRVHTQSAENVILEKRKNNLLSQIPHPYPSPQGEGICAHAFCSGICAHTFCSRDMRTRLLLGDLRTHLLLTGCSLGVQHPRPSRGGARGGVCNFNAKRQCTHPER